MAAMSSALGSNVERSCIPPRGFTALFFAATPPAPPPPPMTGSLALEAIPPPPPPPLSPPGLAEVGRFVRRFVVVRPTVDMDEVENVERAVSGASDMQKEILALDSLCADKAVWIGTKEVFPVANVHTSMEQVNRMSVAKVHEWLPCFFLGTYQML